MIKKIVFIVSITIVLVVGVVLAKPLIITLINQGLSGLDLNNNDNDNNDDNEPIDNPSNPNAGPKLTCFDFVDQSLEQDGMKHLGGSIWGRGFKNQFIFDVSKLNFSIIDEWNTAVTPEDWYTVDYYRYVSARYVHSKEEVHLSPTSEASPEHATFIIKGDYPAGQEGNFYEMNQWMNYYVERFEKYGCSIEDLKEETLLGSFKTKMSKATQADVVSVFDRKSDDGVLRYFADVHKPGKIEDHPRHVEINTFEDYDILDSDVREVGKFEGMALFIATYKDYTKRTYQRDFDNVQGVALTEFIKDVAYEYTVSSREHPRTPTLGIYFIYIDNPNKQFEYLYKPTAGSGFTQNLMTYRIPYETNLIQANVRDIQARVINPYDPGQIRNQIRHFIHNLKYVSPQVKFAPDFATNYTRPFNLRWQAMMGLTELYAEKYNLTVDNIKYHN